MANTQWILLLAASVVFALSGIGTNGLSATSDRESRKLFGGYRITPKFCKASKSLPKSDPRSHGPTICMFNHECSQRQGQVVGACMDGFLFGACCQLSGMVETSLTQSNSYENSGQQSNSALASTYESYGENNAQTLNQDKWQSGTEDDKPQSGGNYGGNQQPANSYYESIELESNANADNNVDGNQIFVSEMNSNTQQPLIDESMISDEKLEISSLSPSIITNDGSSGSSGISSTNHFGIITKDDLSFSPELPTHIPAVSSSEDASSSSEMDGVHLPTASSDTFTSSGHISSTMMHSNAQLFDSQFTESGITHPGADSILIEKLDKEETSDLNIDDYTTTSTTERQKVTYSKPVFKPKPKPTISSAGESGGQYVLVHTINKPTPNDQSPRPTINEHHVESIESIILMLNETKTGPQYDTVSSTEHNNYNQLNEGNVLVSSVTPSNYPSSTIDYDKYGSSSYYITTKNPEITLSTEAQSARPSYVVETDLSNHQSLESVEVQTTAASTYGSSGSTYNHVSTVASATHKPSTIVTIQPTKKPYNQASTIKPATRPRPTATKRPVTVSDEVLITPPPTKKNTTRKPSKRPNIKATTKVPSTSYVTGNPTKKQTTVIPNASTNQIYPSGPTRRPPVTGVPDKVTTQGLVTLVTKRPPSTSYVYSPNPTKRPNNKKPAPTKGVTNTDSSTPPETVVIGGFNDYSSTPDSVKIEQASQAQPLGQEISQNTRPSIVTINNYEMIYGLSTEAPSPTVHITPKPTLNSHPSTWSTPTSLSDDFTLPSNTPSTSYVYNSLVTHRPLHSSTQFYGVAPDQKIPAIHEFDDPGYYGPSSPSPSAVQQTISTTSFYSTGSDNQNQYGSSPGYQQNYPQYPSLYQGYPGYYGSTPQYPNPPQVIEAVEYSTLKDETYTSPDDVNNFPPVRNPNLNMSANVPVSNTDYDYSTPAFLEDEVLDNKMGVLVNKIVASLQDEFNDLGELVESPKNKTAAQSDTESVIITTTHKPIATKKPVITTKKPVTRRPTTKLPAGATNVPQRITTKRPIATNAARPGTTVTRPGATNARPVTTKPVTTRRPTGSRITTTTVRPRPATNTTRRPVKRPATTTIVPTTKRPAQRLTTSTTRKPTTTKPSKIQTTTLFDEEESEEEVEEDEDVGEETEEETSPTLGEGRIQCGFRPHVKSGRIVGGKGATFGEWPWQVLVRESTWLGLFTKNKCGGVLISNNYVVTAAHCQPGFLATLVTVFGEYDISGERESKRSITKNVKRVVVHRNYDAATFENDLALLELESPIHYDTHIVPICMPPNDADFTGRMATVTGWGRLKYGGGVPSVLQEVQVPVIENSVCQEMFSTAGHNKKILPSFLCAGYANGQKDSCEGDSGGPLVMQRPDGRWQLAGTVSHGIKCAAPYLPGVYMRTTFYKPWMQSVTGIK